MDDKELEQILAEIREKAGIKSNSEGEIIPPSVNSEKTQESKEILAPPEREAFATRTFEAPEKEQKSEFSIIEENDDPTVIAPPVKYHKEEEPEVYSEDEAHYDDDEFDDEDGSGNNNDNVKKGIIIGLIVLIVAALVTGIYFGFFYDKKDKPTTTQASTVEESPQEETEEKQGTLNPLTGESGFNAKALNKKPVAVVVENEYSAESVRPQWGINKADIVMEAETEFSTRMLFMWADYNKMPEKIGPTRSARPPFIRFSELFDSVFIHAGLSHSKGEYEGADSVFDSDSVQHINLLNLDESGNFFGRDRSRGGSVEHTGYLNGTNTAQLLENKKIDTKLNTSKFSQLKFNKKGKELSKDNAETVRFIWSDTNGGGHCPKIGNYEYDADSKKYTTKDFDSSNGEADVAFTNLIFLLDETEYIVKHNYKSAGNSETYCNYKLAGGKGVVVSRGTYIDITWKIEDGKLVLKNSKDKDVKLNPGKSYIGYGSSNKGGKVTINPTDSE